MDADRWSRLEALYHQATALAGEERTAFLARACGPDRDLFAQVQSLLSESAAGAAFLEEPALTVAARLVADEVPVLTGRTSGPYAIQGLLGAGGMGDVYRARDTALGRDVAIKILPEAFSDDPDRLARFEQEAQFLASLTHPNIGAIYGLHTADGIRGLVLELVEGETLEERIKRGPFPLRHAVRIARQIGDALDVAHQRQIVHRDLKPANIKVTREDITKVLDFGLAKSLTESASAERQHILGTIAYMSPEQRRGDFVDSRTDIWAFGCVLFEMLAGRRAFPGHGTGGAAPDWSLLPPTVPAGVVALLKRCLEEDPQRRRRDIGDVLLDLDEALSSSEAGREPRNGLRLLTVAPLGVAVALLAFAAGWASRAAVPSSARPAFPTWHKLTFDQGYVHAARFGPGGETILYSASWQGSPFRLFTTTTLSPESRALDLPPGGLLAVSGTGELALSLSCTFRPIHGGCLGTLARVPLLGGAPRNLADAVHAADFGPRGALAAVVEDRLEYPIGTRLADRAGLVRISPDGRRLASSEPEVDGRLAVVVREGPQRRVVSTGWTFISGLAWTLDGGAVLVTGVGPDIQDDVVLRIELAGQARPILRAGPRIRVLDAAAPDRLLVDQSSDLRRAWIHDLRAVGERRDLSWLGSSVVDALSADGRAMLLTIRIGPTLEAGRQVESLYPIYLRPTDGGPATFLGNGYGRALSPDGRWALSVVPTEPDRRGASLVVHPLAGGPSRVLDAGGVFLGGRAVNASFAAGNRVLFDAAPRDGATALETYVQSIDGGPAARLMHEPGHVVSPVAPDGERFVSRRADGSLWVATIAPQPSVRLPFTLQRNQLIRQWTDDGRQVFVVALLDDRWLVTRVDVTTGVPQPHAEVRRDPLAERPGINFRVSRDGRTIVFSDTRILSSLFLIKGAR